MYLSYFSFLLTFIEELMASQEVEGFKEQREDQCSLVSGALEEMGSGARMKEWQIWGNMYLEGCDPVVW